MTTAHEMGMTADDICALFSAAEAKLNWPQETCRRERWIFEQVLGVSDETLNRMWVFLKDVRTCPEEVVRFCQQLLAPQALAAD